MILMLTAVCYAATGEYETAGDLYASWGENTPDYICGVWSTDGGMTNLTFAVQKNDAGEAGKAEILDLVNDDSTVTFVYQKYSRNYLAGVQEELLPYFEKNLGLVSSALDETDNEIDLGILEERRDDPETIAMLEELTEKYGDIFTVEYTTAVVHLVDLGALPVTVEKQNNTQYFIFAALCAILVAITVALYAKKRHALAKQTAAGTVTAETQLTTAQVETMVKNSTAEVPADLDDRIMRDIEK